MTIELYQVSYRLLDTPSKDSHRNKLVKGLDNVLSLLKPLCCESCRIDEDWNERDSIKEQVNNLMSSRCAMDYEFEYEVIYEINNI